MSLVNEIQMLFVSDVSGADVSDLTSNFGLFVRNTLVHFAIGFVGYVFWSTHGEWVRRFFTIGFWSYIGAQYLQWLNSRSWPVFFDGFFDVFVLFFGALVALYVTAKDAKGAA